MFYHLSQWMQDAAAGTPWADSLSGLRVLRYITFRSAGAAVTALALSWFFGPLVIRWLKAHFGQNYADRAAEAAPLSERARLKRDVPTMGGLLLVTSLSLTTLLWARVEVAFIQLTLLALVVLAGLGFYDDYTKITQRNARGVTSRVKLAVQTALALAVGLYLLLVPELARLNLVSEIVLPFYKFPVLTGAVGLGLLLTVLTIVGSSNAVNLTDGIDGLAIGCTLIVTFVFLVVTYLAGNIKTAQYLQIPYVPGAGELSVFCAAMLGAGLGFLWYNCHPAQVFMGDTGSLALGGALGIIAVLVHQPFLLFIAGGVFVLEAVSVMLQRGWFRYTRWRTGAGRRIFRMAPIHHHFERLGWAEQQVTMRFYILCILCAVLALSTLKLR